MKTDFDECVESHDLRDKLWFSRGEPSFWTLLKECDPRVTLQPPATEEQIAQVREFIGGNLPSCLENFLKNSNGLFFDRDQIVFPSDQIIEQTQFMRRLDGLPMEHLLFIGALGDGDMFAFAKTKTGEWLHDVFWWEHETDSLCACGLGTYGYVAAHVSWWRANRPISTD